MSSNVCKQETYACKHNHEQALTLTLTHTDSLGNTHAQHPLTLSLSLSLLLSLPFSLSFYFSLPSFLSLSLSPHTQLTSKSPCVSATRLTICLWGNFPLNSRLICLCIIHKPLRSDVAEDLVTVARAARLQNCFYACCNASCSLGCWKVEGATSLSASLIRLCLSRTYALWCCVT